MHGVYPPIVFEVPARRPAAAAAAVKEEEACAAAADNVNHKRKDAPDEDDDAGAGCVWLHKAVKREEVTVVCE
jgi:hypothetical protein